MTWVFILVFLIALFYLRGIVRFAKETKAVVSALVTLALIVFILPLFFIYGLSPWKEGAALAGIYSVFYTVLIFYLVNIKPKNEQK